TPRYARAPGPGVFRFTPLKEYFTTALATLLLDPACSRVFTEGACLSVPKQLSPPWNQEALIREVVCSEVGSVQLRPTGPSQRSLGFGMVSVSSYRLVPLLMKLYRWPRTSI